jgi:hypothetical protein
MVDHIVAVSQEEQKESSDNLFHSLISSAILIVDIIVALYHTHHTYLAGLFG